MSNGKSRIRRVCQFCKKVYGYKCGFGVAGDSHGICPDCAASPQHEACGFPIWYCKKMGICEAAVGGSPQDVTIRG